MAHQSEQHEPGREAALRALAREHVENGAGMGDAARGDELVDYKSRSWAQKGWSSWLEWEQRCRLEPMKKVGQTIKRHLWES